MLIRSKITTAAMAVAAMLASTSAFAGTTVPEPGTWALLGLAAAIGIAVSRKKRK